MTLISEFLTDQTAISFLNLKG